MHIGLVMDRSRLIDAVADQFQEVFERLLIFDFFFNRLGKLKVDFSEVHSDGLWSHLLEEIFDKVEGEAVFLGSASGTEALSIN